MFLKYQGNNKFGSNIQDNSWRSRTSGNLSSSCNELLTRLLVRAELRFSHKC